MNPNLKSPITAQQEANLRHLAKMLLKFKPNSVSRFDMRQYADNLLLSTTECGSVGCAVGHGPYFGIKKSPKEDWMGYSDRVFGLCEAESLWCFSSIWAYRDNTPQGASKRITWLLDKGLPSDWNAQTNGKAPLCYE